MSRWSERIAIVGTTVTLAAAAVAASTYAQDDGGTLPSGTVALTATPDAAGPQLSAYDGWVVWSAGHGAHWQLQAWHAGRVVTLPVAPRGVPFDAEVGPGADGRPTVVFSRCLHEPVGTQVLSSSPIWQDASGCRLFELALGSAGPAQRIPGLPEPAGVSDTAPAIWHGAVAFGRRVGGQARSLVLLWQPARGLTQLPGDTDTPWAHAAVAQMTLSATQAAFVWQSPKLGVGGYGWRIRVDPLDGADTLAADAGGGLAGTCGYREPLSPSLDGDALFWVRDSSPCDDATSYFATLDPSGAGTPQLAQSVGGFVLSLARDGSVTYWIRDDLPRPTDRYANWLPSWDDCTSHPQDCTLMRSARLPFTG